MSRAKTTYGKLKTLPQNSNTSKRVERWLALRIVLNRVLTSKALVTWIKRQAIEDGAMTQKVIWQALIKHTNTPTLEDIRGAVEKKSGGLLVPTLSWISRVESRMFTRIHFVIVLLEGAP